MTHHSEIFDSDAQLDVPDQAESVLSVKKIQQLSVKPTTRILDSDVRLKKDIETA
ncbi:hypothetical protein OHB12_08265 [Nocardia sp. NBC_01730]|uniref:hypothetical protein n=1 Tax=Nocardia sp. NBC_01730 TaxID=2975998 RepID=UPI002E12C157|nr:hypothetical protein OHB12_08265 [Nocardia sp. NBC_01730]